MGTFNGHALPGSFFILYGLWSIWHILEKFYRRKSYELNKSNEQVPKFTNRISNPIIIKHSNVVVNRYCCKQVIPIDSAFKLIVSLLGIITETYPHLIDGPDVVFTTHSAQHLSMYAWFAFSGFLELCICYKVIKIPLESEYLFTSMALVSELFLFLFHLHGRSPLNVYLHLLLTSMIILGILISIAELLHPHEPIYGLMRSWTYLMQGTWFWQVGAILYPKTSWMPIWDQLAKQSIPAAANLFAYHMLGNFVVIILMIILVLMYTKVGFMNAETMTTRLSSTLIRRQHIHQQIEKEQEDFPTDNDPDEIEMWNYHRNTNSTNDVVKNVNG
ncbi:Transmembrane protein [Schistosoma japonicum]|uniref:Transmembrane protein n=1 Tax=Schistosoma japonicum TaxID=6182 RepID=A0A4Z2D7C7_SCHJA|nr:Transmembrane protein [Schistosoma japonicum]